MVEIGWHQSSSSSTVVPSIRIVNHITKIKWEERKENTKNGNRAWNMTPLVFISDWWFVHLLPTITLLHIEASSYIDRFNSSPHGNCFFLSPLLYLVKIRFADDRTFIGTRWAWCFFLHVEINLDCNRFVHSINISLQKKWMGDERINSPKAIGIIWNGPIHLH